MMKPNPFEQRMRRGEYFHALRIPDDVWTVLRLDGRSFSKFTASRFEKPFDEKFHTLMVETSVALMEEFKGLFCYTESDEISLLLPREWTLFDREVEKIISLSASVAAASFSLSLGEVAHFDSRIWFGTREQDVIDYFRWRQADAARCALNGWAYWTLRKSGQTKQQATRTLHKATRAEKNELLYSHGINFNDLPAWQRRGAAVMWQRYEKTGKTPLTGETVTAMRRRLYVERELPMKQAYDSFLFQILQERL